MADEAHERGGRGWGGAALFAAAVAAAVAPLWAVPYLPTQDGPCHLANALIIRDLGRPDTRYAEFFERRFEPYPNWAAFVLLVPLSTAVGPTAAEKVLASAYVAGFAYGYRYFLRALRPGTPGLAHAALLFVFNRCFFMGFYNYCLSTALVFVVLGYCLRRAGRFGAGSTAGLAGLLLATYFTHLVGFALAAAGAALVLGWRPGRWRRLALAAAAACPAAALVLDHVTRTQFATGGQGGRLASDVVSGFALRPLDRLAERLAELNAAVFSAHDHQVALGWLTLAFLVAAAALAWRRVPGDNPGPDAPPRGPVGLFAALLAAAYVVLPESVGRHGGFLTTRLPFLIPLLALGALPSPARAAPRRALAAALAVLVAANVALFAAALRDAQPDLAEFTAGVPFAGRGKTLLPVLAATTPPGGANYLCHAADYYCLTTRNVNLDNYEARSLNFPVHELRPFDPVQAAAEAPDLVLCWDRPLPDTLPPGYRVLCRRGRLTLYGRGDGAAAP